jgi:hypothetical protein
MTIYRMPRDSGITSQVAAHLIPGTGGGNSAWRGAALCMIAVNIADSGLAFACFGRLSADFFNGGRSCARGDFSW